MGLMIDASGESAAMPGTKDAGDRARPPRYVSEFESDIRQLYLRMMDEPVPRRMIDILRAGLTGPKS
jgi:hypothetical protein